MRWKIPNTDYLDYLRENYDSRIPYTRYGESTFKPFFGELFDLGDIVYLTQISHPQPRHERIKNNMDFQKINRPSDGRLMTIVNLNYMFPIHKSLVTDLKYKEIDLYIKFDDEDVKKRRVNFLDLQLREINKLKLDVKAKKLYEHKYAYPDDAISLRCMDFKKLEEGCLKYMANNSNHQTDNVVNDSLEEIRGR